MGCCGRKREASASSLRRAAADAASGVGGRASVSGDPVEFVYVGATALRVRGGISGRVYAFGAPGAVVEVDPRDAAGVSAVPNLKRVRR